MPGRCSELFPSQVVTALCRYNLAPETVVAVLDLAQHYKITGLANAAAAVIAEQMSVTNVCSVLEAASRFNREDLIKRCTEVRVSLN